MTCYFFVAGMAVVAELDLDDDVDSVAVAIQGYVDAVLEAGLR